MKRQQGLYGVDERKTLRRSYESPVVQTLYGEWLGHPGSHEVRGRGGCVGERVCAGRVRCKAKG